MLKQSLEMLLIQKGKYHVYQRERNESSCQTKFPLVSQGYRTKEDEFEFNKDVGMYVCKAGHMAIRKARQGKKM
ncbi:hypothetical protein JOD43_002641 [Pullulanibacillus pueri]|uniref:Uncharacterized protein n=1 Tax=Pullulanibacillus pueri TaxID=1437324 RepID=A0A8J3EM93_9BACL|nr:hypothetical protein [Pullulanibacillus pueri]GGH82296.1 hypothetical protein GCM10007096_21480 [Pullulanibacillus pueri]